MNKIRIIPDRSYIGEGISRGLARGLLVYYADQNLTGEGMGIGSIAFRNPDCTYFSRSWTDSSEAGVYKRTFTLDTRMRWSIHGRPSDLLTRLIEYGISAYMQLPGSRGVSCCRCPHSAPCSAFTLFSKPYLPVERSPFHIG